MENEIERKFYKQLDAKVKTKSKKQKKSTIHFSMVKSTSHLLNEIFRLKRGERKKESRDYQLIQRYDYDVVEIGNTLKLIYPVAKGNSSIKYYVRKEDIFGVIHDAHLATVIVDEAE